MRPSAHCSVRTIPIFSLVRGWPTCSSGSVLAVARVTIVALSVLLGARAALADECAAFKLAASGRYAHDALHCYAAPESGQGRDLAACLRRQERALEGAFARLERRGNCATVGDVGRMESAFRGASVGLVETLRSAGGNQCSSQKLRAAGDEAQHLFFCNAVAVKRGAGYGVEPTCVANAQQRLAAAFARSDRTASCVGQTGNAPIVDQQVVKMTLGGRHALAPAMSSCSPVEVSVMHGDNMLGNARLAKIVNGAVPCMHVEDGTVATCHFSDATASGKWIESPDGSFALAGQAVTLDGAPGGDYVIATRVSDANPASCLEMPSMDTQGRTAPGIELVEFCDVQEVLQPYNALVASDDPRFGDFYRLRNFVPDGYEVCTANNPEGNHPHPEGAELVRSYARSGIPGAPPDTFCYTGFGAALNDINGNERDASGYYITDLNACHRLYSGGYEVPAAKRPATRSLPAPGAVNTSSLILWRPVNPNVNIATPPSN